MKMEIYTVVTDKKTGRYLRFINAIQHVFTEDETAAKRFESPADAFAMMKGYNVAPNQLLEVDFVELIGDEILGNEIRRVFHAKADLSRLEPTDPFARREAAPGEPESIGRSLRKKKAKNPKIVVDKPAG